MAAVHSDARCRGRDDYSLETARSNPSSRSLLRSWSRSSLRSLAPARIIGKLSGGEWKELEDPGELEDVVEISALSHEVMRKQMSVNLNL